MESAGIKLFTQDTPLWSHFTERGPSLKNQKECWETVEPNYDFGEVFSCLDVNCLASLQIARPPESDLLRRESSDSHLGDSYVVCTPVKILDTVFMAPKIFWMF